MTLTWNGRPFQPVNVAFFAALHVGALFAPWTFTWTGFGIALVLYWLSASVGICLCYHRLLTHRGFKVPKPVEYFLTVCGNLASEGGAIDWVARHRYHHIFSDRPNKDLHTPKDGFWWSHMGWIVCDLGVKGDEIAAQHAPELVADPVHRFLNRTYLLPNILIGLGLYALGGWSYVVWGIFLRMVFVYHCTWLVNSAAHTFGYRTYDTPEGSTNCWWVGLLAWGEGWHNNHHAFQRSARHGHEWWELDLTWWTIRTMAAVGLVRDLHLLPATAARFRLDQRGTLSMPGAAEPAA